MNDRSTTVRELMDLVLHFEVPALRAAGVQPGAAELILQGSLTDGRIIRAHVPVNVTG